MLSQSFGYMCFLMLVFTRRSLATIIDNESRTVALRFMRKEGVSNRVGKRPTTSGQRTGRVGTVGWEMRTGQKLMPDQQDLAQTYKCWQSSPHKPDESNTSRALCPILPSLWSDAAWLLWSNFFSLRRYRAVGEARW